MIALLVIVLRDGNLGTPDLMKSYGIHISLGPNFCVGCDIAGPSINVVFPSHVDNAVSFNLIPIFENSTTPASLQAVCVSEINAFTPEVS